MPRQVQPLQVTEVLRYREITGDWNLIGFDFGPDRRITALLSATPSPGQHFPPIAPRATIQSRELRGPHAILSFDDGTIGAMTFSVVVPPGKRAYSGAFPLPGGSWTLLRHGGFDRISVDGTVEQEMEVQVGVFTQATSDGRIWGGFDDQMMGESGNWDGVRCVSPTGEVVFRFNDVLPKRRAAPWIWSCEGLNVATDRDVWIGCLCVDDGPFRTRGTCLLHLVDLEVAGVLPWKPFIGKWGSFLDSFAIADATVLAQPSAWSIKSDSRSQSSPHQHLYARSLRTGADVRAFLPVTRDGRWIGTFSSVGRGPWLYLMTDSTLYRVDAQELA